MNIIIDTRFRRVRRNGTLHASLPFFIAYNFCCNYHGMVPQDTRVPFTSRALCSSVLLPRHFASLLYNNTRTVFRDVYDGFTVAFCFSQISEFVRLRLLSLVLPGKEPPSPDGRHPDLSFLAASTAGVYLVACFCGSFSVNANVSIPHTYYRDITLF